MLPVPQNLEPMEAKPVPDLPKGEAWRYEPKWDGYRCLAFRDGPHVSIYSKRGTLLNRYFPEVVAGLAKLKAKQFVLDGELMVMSSGQPDFDNLQLRMHPAESRIKKLAEDYRERGVALVAIQPNNPNAVRLDEMGYTDVGDSFEEMKIRAAYRHFNFPYLYDGEDQKISRMYGPFATPHLFIFDAERKLAYRGQLDGSRPGNNVPVTGKDLRDAIEAVLAGKPVEGVQKPSIGCNIKWKP